MDAFFNNIKLGDPAQGLGGDRRSYVGDEAIARPSRIIVHSFAATPGDIPADAAISGQYDRRATPQSAQEVAVGRKLGDQVATRLVDEILKMGLPAERAGSGPPPQLTYEFMVIVPELQRR